MKNNTINLKAENVGAVHIHTHTQIPYKWMETIYSTRELYFSEIKKAILEIVDALLIVQIKIKDRNIKPVPIMNTG